MLKGRAFHIYLEKDLFKAVNKRAALLKKSRSAVINELLAAQLSKIDCDQVRGFLSGEGALDAR